MSEQCWQGIAQITHQYQSHMKKQYLTEVTKGEQKVNFSFITRQSRERIAHQLDSLGFWPEEIH